MKIRISPGWNGMEMKYTFRIMIRRFFSKKAIGIIKGWIDQLVENYPDDRFVVFASFDDGSSMVEECEREMSFTLRFWKKRDGQGHDENMECNQPIIRWSN